jgi:7,8-dihydropterin-6-yl-methyl-4-(beta-D-ribofuranosyl)aminobenzene 5'-phosphate synthase
MAGKKLKIHVLVDNQAGKECKAQHGLSYLVEYDKKVLFDFGQGDLFIQNARQKKWDIEALDALVLSHGHYDHGNGLRFMKKGELVAHPAIFTTRFSGKERKPVGLNSTKEQLSGKLTLKLSKEPQFISDSMVFLGEIPRKIPFENQPVGFWLEGNKQDILPDDSALVIILPEGLFVISGCAHSGICNIIEHAVKVTGIDKVYGVMGGFHLKENNQQTQETIQYLKRRDIDIILPSHCTELPALAALYTEFGFEQVKAGTLYTFPK